MIKEGKINYLNNGRIPSNKPVISSTFKRRTEEYSNNGRIPKNLKIFVTMFFGAQVLQKGILILQT